jgi:hypothetical protein
MPEPLGQEHDRRQEQQHERNCPVETAEFRFQPRVQTGLQAASVIGIGAVVLERACVARLRWSAIVNNTPLVIRFDSQQLPTHGTFPEIHFLPVNETGVSLHLGALVRMTRQELKHKCHSHQKGRIAEREEHLVVDAGNHAPDPFDSTISVNSTSLGASRLVRGFM